MTATYAFSNGTGALQIATGTNLNFTGTWSSSGTYLNSRLDVVVYNYTDYVCITDNVGYNPSIPSTTSSPQKWSALVLLNGQFFN